MSGTFQKVADDWTALTDAQKIALFKATNYETATPAQLATLGKFRIVTYANDNTQPTCTVTATPKDQIVLPKELINIYSFENIDSIAITETNDINTVALLHFDDSTIKDECGNNWKEIGAPTLDSTQSKFGGKSLYLNNSSYLQLTDSMDTSQLKLTGDFTIDWWEYQLAGGHQYPVAISIGSTPGVDGNGILAGHHHGSTIGFYRGNGSWAIANKKIGTVEYNVWKHLAVCKEGNSYYLFENGNLITSFTSTSTVSFGTNAYIGNYGLNGNYIWYGYLDEIRISNVARWTSNFTPPTSPYTVDNKYIKYAFTTDLTNYKVYNTTTSTWDTIQSYNILTDGMTTAQISSLTSAQIMQLAGSASGLGIAMGIPSSKVALVDNLAMQVDMKGAWNHATYGTDVTYGYTNNNVLSVKLLTSGDYKINYNNLGVTT